jgi:hypothetical protein|tara:strand:+ start:191 stop:448 length:258 start_codon:yes stop_codon:yes gene_type:complete
MYDAARSLERIASISLGEKRPSFFAHAFASTVDCALGVSGGGFEGERAFFERGVLNAMGVVFPSFFFFAADRRFFFRAAAARRDF